MITELLQAQAAQSFVLQILFGFCALLMGLILVTVIRFARAGVWRHLSQDQKLSPLDLFTLRKTVRAIEIIAQIAPMLGLLGTVLGMIEVFQVVASQTGMAQPSDLATGIWEALLTTAMGLIVAVPASLAAAFFETSLERHYPPSTMGGNS